MVYIHLLRCFQLLVVSLLISLSPSLFKTYHQTMKYQGARNKKTWVKLEFEVGFIGEAGGNSYIWIFTRFFRITNSICSRIFPLSGDSKIWMTEVWLYLELLFPVLRFFKIRARKLSLLHHLSRHDVTVCWDSEACTVLNLMNLGLNLDWI